MKKFYLSIVLLLCFILGTVQAKSLAIQEEKSNEANFVIQKDLDRELIVYLHDKSGNSVQCTHPEKNGNFLFTELPDGKYFITVYNINGYESEHYCVKSKDGVVCTNLKQVLKPENLANANESFDYYSCEAKSDLNLSLTPNALPNKSDIEFTTHKESNVLVVITDEKGENVRMIPVGEMKPGVHSITFDTSGLKGVYQVSAQAGKQQSTCTIKVK